MVIVSYLVQWHLLVRRVTPLYTNEYEVLRRVCAVQCICSHHQADGLGEIRTLYAVGGVGQCNNRSVGYVQ